jgi:phage-related protein
MAFDAGSIIARLDLDDTEFDRKLRRDVARIEQFEKSSRGLRLTPEAGDLADARRAFTNLDRQVTADAQQRARSGQGSVFGALMGLTSARLAGAPSAGQTAVGRNIRDLGGGGAGGGGLLGGLASGAGPGVLGIGAKVAGITGLAGLGIGALPALTAPLLAGGVGALGAGVIGLGAKQLIGTQQAPGQLYNPAQALLKQMEETFTKGAQPLVAPLRRAFAELGGPGGIIANLQQPLRQLFSGAATLIQPLVHGLTDLVRMILPGLGAAFRAVAPLVQPLLDGIGGLVRGLLPGLVSLLRASAPAVSVFAQILGTLGDDLGKMLTYFVPVLSQSAVILRALLGIVGGLLPLIGQLASIFARALAPVVGAFAQALRALEPTLIIVGRVIADLAGAALKDLAGLLISVAGLLAGISPAVAILARALGQLFNVLESSGVFAELSSALEIITPSLAMLINLLVRQLAPELPILITLLAQVSTVLITLVAAGLNTVLTGVIGLLRAFPFLVPLIGAITAAWLAWNLVMSANPIGLIIIAIAALIGAVTLLATHWHRVWTDISNWGKDAWEFLTHGWGQFLIPGLTLIRLTVGFVADHWRQAWQDMTGWAVDGWHAIYDNAISPLIGLMTQTLPGAFLTAVRLIGQAWSAITGTIRKPIAWVVDNVLDGLIRVFDDITNAVGLGKPVPEVHPFGLAGGGRITKGSTGTADDVLARVSRGETVISAAHSAMLAPLFEAIGVPGYATGGVPGGLGKQRATTATGSGVIGKIADIGKITAALFSDNSTAFANAFDDMLGHGGSGGMGGVLGKALLAMPGVLVKDIFKYLFGRVGAFASGNAIVQKALSYVGKVPYVWGGTSPAGWDCSGMVEYIYRLFGINPPRTSEAQFSWVRRTPSPVPGGLAFFAGADGTQADPGHVGIAINGTKMVNAYGTGFGTIISSIAGSSGAISGYGVPPHNAIGIAPGLAVGGDVIQWLKMAMSDTFAPAGWLPALETLVGKESGGSPTAVNPITVNGEHASGLFQTLPSTYAAYATVPGGIFNPVSDAVAGIRYIMARYGSPYNIPGLMSGNYQGYDAGGWLMPGATVAVNSTGMPEAVLSPGQSRALLGGGGGGRLASVINIMLPEGTTVAQAINELTFALRVSDQQALAGAGMRPGG